MILRPYFLEARYLIIKICITASERSLEYDKDIIDR